MSKSVAAATTMTTAHKMPKVHPKHSTDRDYELLMQRLQERLDRVAVHDKLRFFTTDAAGLFDAFLTGLPAGKTRQHYTCHSCRHFFEQFGGIASVDDNGNRETGLWDFVVPKTFTASVDAVRKLVSRAKITGVFLSGKATLGTPKTGIWSHIHAVLPPSRAIVSERKDTAGQQMAAKREEHGMLCHAISDYKRDVVEKAVALLETDALYRSEKCLGVAKWFLNLHLAIENADRALRGNIIWHAVATAPVGWCHVRSSMIGTLLDDMAEGMDFATVSKRFAEKMHPLQYQRPTAPPSLGNIEAAEKLIAKMGLAPALARRFATLDDIKAIWTPPKLLGKEGKAGGVFDHLKNQERGAALEVPAKRITWEKFRAEVLPTAERIDYLVPAHGPFITLVTATNPDAPPILQWDHEGNRNQVSWYVQPGGSTASRYSLSAGSMVKVTAVTLMPPQWDKTRTYANFEKGAIFILEGAKDAHNRCLGLFPECLKSELHEVRATIEAHSNSGTLTGEENASACGVDLRAFTQAFRVKAAGSAVLVNYLIDRWS
jgi:hypothetical protein